MTKRKYTKEILQEAAANSFSVAGVLRYLGLRQAGGTNSHISKMMRDLDVDTSHFTGQGWNKGKVSNSRRTADQILILRSERDRREDRKRLLRALIEIGRIYVCECGQQPVWNELPLTLHIDHINGNPWDDRRENLRFLCPNCHAQQETNKPWKNNSQ